MWGLDRFSNHASTATSPPAAQRPYSPAPSRRSTQLAAQARPSINTRSSSQSSLVSNTSGTAPASSSRQPTSSGLKNQIRNGPAPNVEDPLRALDRIVGTGNTATPNGDSVDLNNRPVEKPTVVVDGIDFENLSLDEYAARGALHVPDASATPSYSEQSVEEYEKARDKFEELHKSINACDEVLQSVEKYLSSFQTDLGAVSHEIETLQTRSTTLNGKLENRRMVERLLGPTVDRIGLPSSVVKKISEGPLDEGWVRALEELQRRSKTLEAEDLGNVHALQDLKPLIEDLSNKAVQRIRDYFAAQIRSLRSANINAQLIQQQGFLRFKSIYVFLAARQPQLAEEIMQAYANTMRWYYHTHFSRYLASLSKLKLYTTDRHDVLGEDPTTTHRNRNPSNSNPSQDIFSLARRIDVIRTPSSSAIPAHAADESRQSHHIETPYLAYNLALIDNASFEYTFLTAFFSNDDASSTPTTAQPSPAPSNLAALNRHFHTIFSAVANLGSTLTKTLISDTYDALGILLLVRLTQHFAFTIQRRKIPTLEPYINGTHMLLWPRFQVILDAHSNSLKQLTASLPSRVSAASSSSGAFSTMSGGSGGGAGNGSSPNTAPHPVTQRFANLAHGIVALSSEAGDDEPVSNSLARLRGEFDAFLAKVAGSFGSGDKGRRDKKRFLANNYALVLAVLADGRGRLADDTRKHFEELKQESA